MNQNKFILVILVVLLTQVNAFSKTTILLYIPSSVTSDLSRMFYKKVKAFEKLNPEIKVEFNSKDSYSGVLAEVLKNSLNKKSSGVIIAELSELPTLVDSYTVIALDDFINREQELLPNILPTFLHNSYDKNKVLYGLPMFRSTPAIYYNLNILKQAGIDQNNLPQDWKALKEVLKKLKEVTKKPPFLLAPDWFDWIFESFVIQSGGSLSNANNTDVQFDHPATIEALKYWKELKDEGLLKRNNRNWKSTINMFNYQAYPITYYSTAGMGFLKDNAKFTWTTDLMPKNRVYGTTVGASTVFISNYMTKGQQKASWKLLKYLLSDDVQIDMSLQSGYLAVTKSAYKNNKMVRRYSNPPFKKIKEQLKFAKSKIMIKNYSKIREVLKQAINRSLDDGMDPEKSLKIAQNEARKLLN